MCIRDRNEYNRASGLFGKFLTIKKVSQAQTKDKLDSNYNSGELKSYFHRIPKYWIIKHIKIILQFDKIESWRKNFPGKKAEIDVIKNRINQQRENDSESRKDQQVRNAFIKFS